ncbi:MAG: TRAP transporter small permease [Rhizobiales bacterium]|nr:TRAP transporter small permease [Hyphomicrobiales bacterium]
MAHNDASYWLGSARKPVKLLMMAFTVAVLALSAWLIIGALFLGSEIGLKQFLSPRSNTIVMTTTICGWLAILFGCMYLSDRRGAIETKSRGFFDVVSLIFARLAMLAVAGIVMVMFYEVIMRYIFEKPTLWANELSLWMAGFVFLLAGLYAMQQRSHIRIYVIYDMMPRWMKKASDVVAVFLIWAFAAALVWGGFNEAKSKFIRWETFGTAWDPPLPATIKTGILVIIVLVAIQALSNLLADWHKEPESHSPMDDIDESEIENIRQSIKD